MRARARVCVCYMTYGPVNDWSHVHRQVFLLVNNNSKQLNTWKDLSYKITSLMHKISKVYFVTKLYMLRASSVSVIRSYRLYTWQLVRFMQVMWLLPSRVRLELATDVQIVFLWILSLITEQFWSRDYVKKKQMINHQRHFVHKQPFSP